MEEDKTFEFLELCLPNYSSRDDVALLLDLDMFYNNELEYDELIRQHHILRRDSIAQVIMFYRKLKDDLIVEAVNNLDFKSIKTLQ